MQFISKYIDDTLSQSRLASSHKKNAFKYLIDQYESSSEYNILYNELCKTRVLIGLEECVIRV